jgi:hypothetical protein
MLGINLMRSFRANFGQELKKSTMESVEMNKSRSLVLSTGFQMERKTR